MLHGCLIMERNGISLKRAGDRRKTHNKRRCDVGIIGLTDRGAALPRLGVLRKGAPKPSEKQPGRDLGDCFRFDTDDTDALEHFTAIYGEKPNHIRVMLMYATVSENFETWQEHHSAGALKHRCDGRTCVLWLDERTGRYQHTPKECPSLALLRENPNIDKKHLCRPVGRLKLVLPELERMAYVLLQTTSINDILELQSNLEAFAAMRGDLRGMPLILSRKARKVSTPGSDGKRARREKWLLSLEPAPDWVRAQLVTMERAALPGAPRALPAPVIDTTTGEILDSADEQARRDELMSGLRNVLDAYRADGGTWELTQRQVAGMSIAALINEIGTIEEAHNALSDAQRDEEETTVIDAVPDDEWDEAAHEAERETIGAEDLL